MTGPARSFAVVESFHGEHHHSGMCRMSHRATASPVVAPSMTPVSNASLTVGRYLISPLVRDADDGGYSASVSIKSGSGTHDRVLRPIGRFRTPDTARRHALAEGLDDLRSRFGAASLLSVSLCSRGAP